MYARSFARRTRKKKAPLPRLEAHGERGAISVPGWVVDHDSYRRWARSDEFPEQGRFAFLNGIIWIDLARQQLFTEVAIKGEVTARLRLIVDSDDLGYLFSSGALISHAGAELSCQPDACFISYDSVQSGRAKWIEGAEQGYVEVEGTPDMVLEVVSDSSVQKDTIHLRELYWKAGVAEYWLVDARGSDLKFSLLKRNGKGYAETRRGADGWVKSAVFGRSFRLVTGKDRLGNPRITLEVRQVRREVVASEPLTVG
jgi:Uma2 family endonuclease